MFVIGITGMIGSGKSTVAVMFAQLGAKLIDADRIARRETLKGGACYAPIVKYFGKDVLRKGTIDRKKLGDLVFNDSKGLKKLMGIIHPVVRKITKEKINTYQRKDRSSIIVLDVPLLFEYGFNRYADWTIAVKSTDKQQLARAGKGLNLTPQQIKARLAHQMPIADKIRRADFIIDNRGTKKQTQKQVKRIWQKLQHEKKR